MEASTERTGVGGLVMTLVLTAAWAVLSLGVSPRFTDPLIGLCCLLLASTVLCLGTVCAMRLHGGRERLLVLVILAPALVLLLTGLMGSVLGARDLWSQASAHRAFVTAYQEIPILATQQELIPIDRAWAIVRELPATQSAETFASGGREGLAQALSARFGDSVPHEGARLADLVAGRARAVALWSRIQVLGIGLALVLTLVLVGRSVDRWLVLLRGTS